MEKRCNNVAEKGKSNTNWMLNQIIRFLHFQKKRVEEEEITAATLKNFIKSLKVFCESADIDIPWKKVTRGHKRTLIKINKHALIRSIDLNRQAYDDFRDECTRFVNDIKKELLSPRH